MRTALILAAAACAAPKTTSLEQALVASSPTGCYDPAAYGAHPTPPTAGMVDARPGIQAAIDAAPDYSTVCLGPGRWEMSRATVGSWSRVVSLVVHGKHHVTIAGVGPETVLAPTGDAGLGDWYGLEVTQGADVTVRDLTVDMSGLTNTEEQTHAVQVLGPQAGTRLSRVVFNLPHPATNRAGDCLRLLGNAGALVTDTVVEVVTFEQCARSGIAIQRGVNGTLVLGSTSNAIHDAAIDSEPSAPGGNVGLQVVGSHFNDTGEAQGDFAVQLGGYDAPMSHVTLVGDDFARRGVWGYRTANATVTGCTVEGSPKVSGGGLLEFRNTTGDLVLSGDVLTRSGSVSGAVVRVVAQGGGAGQHVSLVGDRLTSSTPGQGVYMESVQDLTLADLDVDFTGPSTGNFCVSLRAVTRQLDGVDVHDVRCKAAAPGGALAAVYLSSSPGGVGSVSVHDNMSKNATQGLRCDGSGAFTRPVVYGGNNFDGTQAASASCPPSVATLVPQLP